MEQSERSSEISMQELAALVETAGGQAVGMMIQNRPTPDPRSFIGDGKVAELKEFIEMNNCDLAVFDNELSPSQMRVLGEELGVKVLDRSGLILDIFAQRAQTREGQLQVELAQYKYLLPRLTGMWTHLVRQTASGGSSPIGTRGPGETQLETDRRHIRRKIQKLEEELAAVRKVRSTQRRKREKNDVPVVALVGYTNAGKSTLLNMMAGLEKPTKGTITIFGERIDKMSERKLAIFRQKNMGFVFQSYNLLPNLTAIDNVAMPMMFSGIKRRVSDKQAKQMLKMCGLGKRMRHKPTQMSGGQQQRVGIARAFVAKPKIVFADEPTGNLDTRTTIEIMEMMVSMARENHQTLVIVTHDVEIAAYADKIYHIIDGVISSVEDNTNKQIGVGSQEAAKIIAAAESV